MIAFINPCVGTSTWMRSFISFFFYDAAIAPHFGRPFRRTMIRARGAPCSCSFSLRTAFSDIRRRKELGREMRPIVFSLIRLHNAFTVWFHLAQPIVISSKPHNLQVTY